jgi:hypothetical protein
MTDLERTNAELRAALILAGKRIVKLNFGRRDDRVLPDRGVRRQRLPPGRGAVSISEAREIAESHWRHYTGAAIEKYELWRRVFERRNYHLRS